jgi:magnesium transporter
MTNRRAVGGLLLYPDDDAGGLMTPEVAGLRDTLSASQALNSLRLSDFRPGQLSQIFVVDHERKLVGYLSLPEIVFAAPFARLRDIMHEDVVSVRTGTDQEECARLMRRYDLRSLPVVDAEGRLEGAISIEDLVEVAEEEATEDMFKMVGSGVQDSPNIPVWRRARIRLPWLIANLATALSAGAVLGIFEATLDRMAVLAVFLPVIMGHAGITGTQALTVIVRSLALDEVGPADTRRLLIGELAFTLLHGLVVGSLLALAALLWQGDPALAGLVAAAMVANLIVASVAGVLVPMAMKLVRVDPATSSTSFLTTVTDIAGIVLYLGPATLLLALFAAD